MWNDDDAITRNFLHKLITSGFHIDAQIREVER
jgi:hypothetical protein